ncbi:hypothetical protein KFE25_002087 [Diacronema lutheri]|uniref:Transmembrane protein n=1 Tax=Diacronema lutheri TaxID=2081491 RepID=A0A8J5XCU5_DIALT|nr:hypothetical protein KFE25_002087 [Diacronema lutheri]
MVPMSDEAMCEAWERLMATSVPAEKRDAIRAGFYAEPSAQARYATLLEFSSYLRQDEQTRARAHAVRRGQRGANPANGNDAAEETRDSLERLIQRQTDTEPSLAWLLGRVVLIAIAVVSLVVFVTLRCASPSHAQLHGLDVFFEHDAHTPALSALKPKMKLRDEV